MKTAVIAGSFDFPTYGHDDIIGRSLDQCDRLIIGVGVNPKKTPMFTTEERVKLLIGSWGGSAKVKVVSYDGLYLKDFAREHGATTIIRGIRDASDLDFERRLFNYNKQWAPEIETLFLMARRELTDISSSFVKSLIGPKGWETVIQSYVNEYVCRKVLEKIKGH